MKITLPATNFVFTPSTNTIDFSPMTGTFLPYRLLAVINVTTGKLVYATASYAAGYGGTFSTNIYPNDTLTYLSSNTGQSASDIIEVLYDSETASQIVSGQVTSQTQDGNGNSIGSVADPTSAYFKLKTASNTYAGDGTPILSTVDPISGGDGLNVHLQSSAYGGELGQPLPSAAYGYQSALSMGFLNNSVLVSPKMDPVTNELIVQANFAAGATQNVNVTEINGTTASVGQAVTDAGTLRVASNQYSSNGATLDYGNGLISSTGSQRMSLGDYTITGPSGVTVVGANIINNTASSNDLNGYRYFSIQIVNTATAGTFIFETSNDDTNWQPLSVSNQSLTTGVIITSAITATVSSFIYIGTLTGRYIRIRVVSTLTGGSAQAVCRFSQVAPVANNVTISQGSSSTVAPNIDVLGSAVSGSRYNQIEIDFNTVPGAGLITNTITGSGTVSASNGHTLYATSSTATSSAKGVSVGIVQYRAANEMYGYFSAAFTISGGSRTANSYQRIGIYDSTNGFFIGYNGVNFGVTKRTATVDTFVNRTAWNGDLLDGSPSSKFTRNNIPEAINFAVSNLFRIRFAWLGSASILFDVFSPDGIWVNYHSIKQPNSDFNPSLTVPNLPMTLDCAKTGSGLEVLTIATACWAGGTSSSYSAITSTLTDNSLAALNRSVITGVTTGGGGGYVNVKVNPSGALVTDSTISGTVATNISQYGGTSTTLGQKAMSASMPVVLASDHSIIDVEQPEIYFTGAINTAAGNNLFNAVAGPGGTDAQGYKSASVQVIFTVAGGSVEFQHSSDNSTWVTIPVFRADSPTPAPITSTITALISSNVYHFPIKMRYIRLNVTGTLSGSPRANLRLSQDSWAPIVPTVVSATAANLNATVAGALTSVGTITTVTGVTTVSTVSAVTSVASSNVAAPALSTDVVSAAITTTTTTGNFTPTAGTGYSVVIPVTVVSGTSPTLQVTIEEADDSGTNFFTVYQFPTITAVGTYRSPPLLLRGNRIRYVQTVTGTSPSFTRSITRFQRSDTVKPYAQIQTTTQNLNATGATSALYVEGMSMFVICCRNTAQTTPATITLEFSSDGTNWLTTTTTLSTIVGSVSNKIQNELWKFARLNVTAAGTGITLGDLCLKAMG